MRVCDVFNVCMVPHTHAEVDISGLQIGWQLFPQSVNACHALPIRNNSDGCAQDILVDAVRRREELKMLWRKSKERKAALLNK